MLNEAQRTDKFCEYYAKWITVFSMLSTISRIRSLLVCFSAMMISFQKK